MRSCLLVLCAVALTGGLRSPVAAAKRNKPTVDVQLFHPAPGPNNFFSTESGEINGHFGVSAGLWVNYARKPLEVRVVEDDGSESSVGSVVENRLDLNVAASIGLFDIGEVGVVVPFIAQGGLQRRKLDEAGIDLGANKLKSFTQGDIRLVPKAQVLNLDQGLFAVAVIPSVIIPSAIGTPFAGEKSFVFAPLAAVSSRIPFLVPIRVGLDLGYRARKKTKIEKLVVDDELFFKLAVGVDITFGTKRPSEIVVEVFGNTPPTNPYGFKSKGKKKKAYESARSPMEIVVGARTEILGIFLITAGVGGGILPGYGAPVPRLFASLTFFTRETPTFDADADGITDDLDKCIDAAEDADGFEDADGCPDPDNDADKIFDVSDGCPDKAEDLDGFKDADGCPDPDNDEDGILDAADKCRDEAEDKDGFKDEDGCPDPDNDEDGVLDAADACRDEAEDKDGFKDEDGCPEPDNDEDGLADAVDLCPTIAEDKDGVADEDGCPEDNDGDGIADADDQCPNKAETFNGIDDSDGCPEKLRVKSLVNVTDQKIEIKDKVYFKSGSAVIRTRSYKLLDQVASVLKNQKRIVKVRVEGYTDSRGSVERNTELSQQRADAVLQYLVSKGVEASRLEAKGFGPEKPVASNSTRRGREANRRVEFVIVETRAYGATSAQPGGTGAAPPAPPPPTPPPAPASRKDELLRELPGPNELPPLPAKPPKAAPDGGKKEEPEIEFNF